MCLITIWKEKQQKQFKIFIQNKNKKKIKFNIYSILFQHNCDKQTNKR